MTPRTVSPAPLDDRRMRRLFLARLHEDGGGSHELSLYGQALYEAATERAPQVQACSKCPRVRRGGERGAGDDGMVREDGRVPIPEFADFEELKRWALRRAETGDAYGRLLSLLVDCRPVPEMREQQRRGAPYRMLAAIGHLAGFDTRERSGWYRVCEAITLCDHNARHILDRLNGQRA